MGGKPLFERMAVVGVGLIGGSLARAARRNGLVNSIVGVGRGMENLARALQLGVIDSLEMDFARGVRDADLIVLAAPVYGIIARMEEVSRCRKPESVVTDVGSVKGGIIREAGKYFGSPSSFVPGHPIAGTEHSGVEASFPSLFENHKCILTPTNETDPAALQKVRRLWESVGAQVLSMDAERHDRIMGFVSHLPHVVAYGLVHAVMEGEKREAGLSGFSAGGFRDFTRIASSHPEMWRDILLLNREAVLEAIDGFASSLDELKRLIDKEDGEGLQVLFSRCKRRRDGPVPASGT